MQAEESGEDTTISCNQQLPDTFSLTIFSAKGCLLTEEQYGKVLICLHFWQKRIPPPVNWMSNMNPKRSHKLTLRPCYILGRKDFHLDMFILLLFGGISTVQFFLPLSSPFPESSVIYCALSFHAASNHWNRLILLHMHAHSQSLTSSRKGTSIAVPFKPCEKALEATAPRV